MSDNLTRLQNIVGKQLGIDPIKIKIDSLGASITNSIAVAFLSDFLKFISSNYKI